MMTTTDQHQIKFNIPQREIKSFEFCDYFIYQDTYIAGVVEPLTSDICIGSEDTPAKITLNSEFCKKFNITSSNYVPYITDDGAIIFKTQAPLEYVTALNEDNSFLISGTAISLISNNTVSTETIFFYSANYHACYITNNEHYEYMTKVAQEQSQRSTTVSKCKEFEKLIWITENHVSGKSLLKAQVLINKINNLYQEIGNLLTEELEKKYSEFVTRIQVINGENL